MLKKDMHGEIACYKAGCRCALCKKANNNRQRAQREFRIARGLPEGDPRHGTMNGAVNWACMCFPCRDVVSGYEAKRDAERQPPEEGSPLHGIYHTYSRRKCRCELCREAFYVYISEWHNRRKPSMVG